MQNQTAVDREDEARNTSDATSEPSFGDILNQFEQQHHAPQKGEAAREGTVVAVTPENIYLDIGMKTDGMVPVASVKDEAGAIPVKVGDKMQVTITGRDSEGYYQLSLIKIERPKDWSALEKAFEEKRTIAGKVTAVVKGGLSVDIGLRAFMPASRSGARDVPEMEKLVGQEITCRIIKLDVAEEDAVVDRRSVLEEETAKAREQLYLNLQEGAIVTGTVRTLMDYGAFIDIGGVDGMMHVADISRGRINKPSDVLTVGQQVQVKILKVDPAKKRISLGMKQLQADPWSTAGEKYHAGERVKGTVSRLTDFGAFIELEPGLDGLIHLSEMSWSKKVKKPADVLKAGEAVEVVVLGVNPAEKRVSLGLKQALGDPWADAEKKFQPGTVVDAPVVSLTKFGAFVQVDEHIEGMIHVGDITAEKRINHPQDVLKVGETVKAVVLECDREKRRLRLGMKQLVPTSLDEYIAEHKEGDVVTGRVSDVSKGRAMVELGEGVRASVSISGAESSEDKPAQEKGADIGALSSMLASRWKSGMGGAASPQKGMARAGEIRSFRIKKLDPANKKIELELAG
jgi:small subunit ribosomal protein S1